MKRYRNTSLYVTREGKVFGPRGERKLIPNNSGYYQVVYRYGNKHKNTLVHRMVAEVYLGESDLEVNHKDNNKLNNSVDNLEWVTHKQNMRQMFKNIDTKIFGNSGEKNGRAKLTQELVYKIKDMLSKKIKHEDIANTFNVSKSTISAISTGRNWN